MIESNKKESDNIDFRWSFPEYEKHERGKTWYWLFYAITIGLLALSLWKLNFFFAVIIIMFAIIVFFREIREPDIVVFSMGKGGIYLGNRPILYKDLKSFWIIYEPPIVKNLYFEFKNALDPKLSIPLLDQNPLEIRKFLLQRLEEDLEQEHESLSDQIGRALKI